LRKRGNRHSKHEIRLEIKKQLESHDNPLERTMSDAGHTGRRRGETRKIKRRRKGGESKVKAEWGRGQKFFGLK